MSSRLRLRGLSCMNPRRTFSKNSHQGPLRPLSLIEVAADILCVQNSFAMPNRFRKFASMRVPGGAS